MKTFARHLTYDELKKQCKRLKVPFDDHLYRERGWDTVLVGEPQGGFVVYNTFNGRYFGRTPAGHSFSSNDPARTPWSQQLLKFFYLEK